jgi:hypothetical protein
MDEITRNRVLANAIRQLSCQPTKTDSALDVLKLLMQMMDNYKNLPGPEKKLVVVRVFEDIASGKDGVLGTADDILPDYVVRSMRMMIEVDLVGKTIDVIYEATVGKVLQTYSFTRKVGACLWTLFCCGCIPHTRGPLDWEDERKALLSAK